MVLEHFKKISSIPRGSRNNRAISDYLVEFAREHGLRYIQDEALNVVIFKDATPGYENCEPLVMQGHMDMVCEKTADSMHDFTTEGIQIIEEDGYLRADGTTLGGDDGIAIAYMLEYLADDTLIHPPLEMVITTDEEIGMCGAMQFDAGVLKGRRMINIDSEEEGIFTVSCAGGLVGDITCDIKREEYTGVMVSVRLAGLAGGHSGIDIAKNRWNAVAAIGRFVGMYDYMLPDDKFRLLSVEGGKKDNVIPNEAVMSIVVCQDAAYEAAEVLYKAADMIINEMAAAEPDAYIEVASGDRKIVIGCDNTGNNDEIINDITECITTGRKDIYRVYDKRSISKLITLFTLVPCGVQVMSAAIEGMVESSCNIGIFNTTEENYKMTISMRSSRKSYLDYMDYRLSSLAELIDAGYETYGGYPGWDMKPVSEFRDTMCKVYRDTFGTDAVVEGVHAGLEGGIFVSKVPDMDIVSIGPDMHDIHTVNERADIASIERVDRFIRNCIESMAKSGE